MANLYENIISVAEAKRYLRLDDSFTEDDEDLERMIATSLEYITKQTNIYFRVQEKTYMQDYECNTFIYDYPITFIDLGDKIPLYYSGYVKFINTEKVVANVGYSSKFEDGFPYALIDCALQMIKVFYYEAEKNVNTTLLPMSVNQIIESYRRFIIA